MNRAEQIKTMHNRIKKLVSEMDEAIEAATHERTVLRILEWKLATSDNVKKLYNVFERAPHHNELHIPSNMMKLGESMDFLEEEWARAKDRVGREVE